MAFTRLRHLALAGAMTLGASLGVVAMAPPAVAMAPPAAPAVAMAPPVSIAGGCGNKNHRVTTDPSHHGVACWIDNGDDIRVCDRNSTDRAYVRAKLWYDAGGFWYRLVTEADGKDSGCDTESFGNLQGYNRLRLRICAVRNGNLFHCNQIIWWERE